MSQYEAGSEDTPGARGWTPEKIRQQVLYKDRLVIVLNKPAAMPVHPGPSGGETVEDWFPHLCFEHPRPPALAHRLDRDTAGCLALGRSQKGSSRLGKLFEQRRIQKTYWAVVRGHPGQEEGTISLPLAKVSAPGGWKVAVDKANGQAAETSWRVMGVSEDYALSWIAFFPKTGRTHQIRVHSQVLGCPLVGDPIYGIAQDRAPEFKPGERPRLRLGPIAMHLLAQSLSIPLYADKPALCISAPPPAHMTAMLSRCGWVAEP